MIQLRTTMSAAVVAALLAAGAARAADVGDPYGYNGGAAVTPVGATEYWRGFYAGVNLGYGFGDGGGADIDGFVGGLTAGFNLQSGPVVFGVEGDIGYTGIGSDAFGYAFDVNWLGTVRGRIGYAFDRFMVYGTAGLAWATTEYSTPAGSSDNTDFGWSFGLGGEAAITDRISAKIEYLHVSLDDHVYAVGGSSVQVDPSTNIIRFGLNYHF